MSTRARRPVRRGRPALRGLVRGVGVVSVGLGALAAVRPQQVAAAGGVREPDAPLLPLLVRLVAARQVSLGLALLTRSPVDVGRASGLFLPTTVLDAAAVLAAVRGGVLRPRSAVMALTVLATNVAVTRADRDR
ncbi:MAG: hypothetical protein JWN17_1451 [Frankiales bacterium]|nr:hypothetical protein [Frankiales bacterium]